MPNVIDTVLNLFRSSETGELIFSKFSPGDTIKNLSTTQKIVAVFALNALVLGTYIYKTRRNMSHLKNKIQETTHDTVSLKFASLLHDIHLAKRYPLLFINGSWRSGNRTDRAQRNLKRALTEHRKASKSRQEKSAYFQYVPQVRQIFKPKLSAVGIANSRNKSTTSITFSTLLKNGALLLGVINAHNGKEIKNLIAKEFPKIFENAMAKVQNTEDESKKSTDNFDSGYSSSGSSGSGSGTFSGSGSGSVDSSTPKEIQGTPPEKEKKPKKPSILRAFEEAIQQMESKIFDNQKFDNQGGTITFSYIDDTNKIKTATLGSNEATILRVDPDNDANPHRELKVLPLSPTRNWSNITEFKRLHKALPARERAQAVRLRKEFKDPINKKHTTDFHPRLVLKSLPNVPESRSIGDKNSEGFLISKAKLSKHNLQVGDIIIHGSRQFHKIVSAEEVRIIIALEKKNGKSKSQDIASALLKHAQQKPGGKNNISISVVQVEGAVGEVKERKKFVQYTLVD